MSHRFIEGLEARRLLSSTFANGTLSVTGTANADNISLSISGANLRLSDNNAIKTFVLAAVKMIQVSGLGGNDTIALASNVGVRAAMDGGAGDDKITGGTGSDTLTGGDGNDSIDGGAGDGNDSLYGGAGNDTLLGRSGNDRLFGDVGNDSINAGKGNDFIDGGLGTDTMIAGDGVDAVSYASHTTKVDISLDGVKNDGSAGALENLGHDIENLTGGSAGDVINGND